MIKYSSKKKLFEVRLPGGKSHPEWKGFYEGVESVNGKAPDYGGINSIAIVGTHHDSRTLRGIITSSMKKRDDIKIIEITRDTLKHPPHSLYQDLIDNYFLPYADYPAVE